MSETGIQHLSEFFVYQKLAMTANRYTVMTGAPGDGGRQLAVAQQKRMALKEQVTFFADDARQQPLFSFRARQALDLNAGYDITDAAGAPLGFFRKDFGQSLLRSTFHLEGPGYAGIGRERNQTIAIVRRFVDLPFRFDFDFVENGTGKPLLSIDRQATLRDRYTVNVPDPRVDWRVAAAVTVGLDALMQR